ncbi:hypothetical protein [Pseudonocardia sp. ICBG1293]|uniref:hypothetical protein n=1 Tax=Pseudonocardia sp. ICBG1293 TaxID=2844382 RepID=UPI001CCC2A65|nr:hypothetical protein [Pseudonocardia sp. ICBG1293]
MRLPGMHALLAAGVAVMTTAGTVSAVSLTAAGQEEPAVPPAPPAVPAPAVPGPPPAAPAPEPTSGSAPVVGDDTGGTTRERGTTAPEPVDPAPAEPAPAVTRAPADPPRTTPERTRERPSGVPDRDASREEEVRFACEQGWMSGALCP